MKTDFELPTDVKNDLVYCQRALTSHILIHQKLAASILKHPNGRLQRSLKLIEKDIMDIGDEQRMLFNRLRFLIDYHQITKNAKFGEREKITNLVRDELQHFSRSTGDVRPKNVQRRLDDHDLYVKYFTSDALMDDEAFKDNSSGNSISDDLRMESNSDDDMKMRMAKQIEQKVYSGPRQPVHKQPAKMVPSLPVNGPSLLKPLHQRKIEANETARIRVVRPETGLQVEKPNITKDQPTQQISMSRLRLAAALCKAKTAQNAQTRVGVDSPEPERMIAALSVKCATPLSSSQSSNDSSGETELIRDELTPDQCSQETFLRIFGLHTPAYTQYLMNRRPQRKKRTCTSTARGDFHYGKFELFEKQFANKRNKKQFLYSPPATRAKRRVGSNGTNASAKDLPKRGRTIKSTASSSSSLSSNGSNNVSEKVCLTCYKRNNLLQCRKCCGQYHATCHTQAIDAGTRKTFCPFCVRQKGGKRS